MCPRVVRRSALAAGRRSAYGRAEVSMVFNPPAVPPAVNPPAAAPANGFAPVEIAVDRCKGCGLCVGACPEHVLVLDGTQVNALGYHPVRIAEPGGCTSCALCARVCPDAVLTIWARPRRAR
jgi:2-oxoglutarate ferredoxin oxidoreductase subunit delta